MAYKKRHGSAGNMGKLLVWNLFDWFSPFLRQHWNPFESKANINLFESDLCSIVSPPPLTTGQLAEGVLLLQYCLHNEKPLGEGREPRVANGETTRDPREDSYPMKLPNETQRLRLGPSEVGGGLVPSVRWWYYESLSFSSFMDRRMSTMYFKLLPQRLNNLFLLWMKQ